MNFLLLILGLFFTSCTHIKSTSINKSKRTVASTFQERTALDAIESLNENNTTLECISSFRIIEPVSNTKSNPFDLSEVIESIGAYNKSLAIKDRVLYYISALTSDCVTINSK